MAVGKTEELTGDRFETRGLWPEMNNLEYPETMAADPTAAGSLR